MYWLILEVLYSFFAKIEFGTEIVTDFMIYFTHGVVEQVFCLRIHLANPVIYLALMSKPHRPRYRTTNWLMCNRALERRGSMPLSKHAKVAKAIDYLLSPNHWPAFTRFLSDGQVCLSNNAAERSLKGVALGRKSWLFAGSERGGQRSLHVFHYRHRRIERHRPAGITPARTATVELEAHAKSSRQSSITAARAGCLRIKFHCDLSRFGCSLPHSDSVSSSRHGYVVLLV